MRCWSKNDTYGVQCDQRMRHDSEHTYDFRDESMMTWNRGKFLSVLYPRLGH